MARQYVSFQVSGQKELARLFEQLPKSLTDGVLRQTASKAVKPVAEVARNMVPKDESDLAESITVSTRLSKRQKRMFSRKGDVVVHAGPSQPRGSHGILVEFGTGARYHKATGRYVGVMPARPFMRPAWDANASQVLHIMRTEIWGVLVKAVRRLRKRAEAGKLSGSQLRHFRGS